MALATRFQILGLRAKDQQELTDIVNAYKIKPPTPGVDPLDEPYYGWIMPVAVRATSGHSYDVKIPLDPLMMMRRLDLKCLGIMQPTQEKYTKSWQTTYAGYSLVDIHVANGEVHETWARDSVSWL